MGNVELSEFGSNKASKVQPSRGAIPTYAILVKEEINTKGKHDDQGELAKIMKEFQDVFPKELPCGVPNDRGMPFKIELMEGATPISRLNYCLVPNYLWDI